MLLMIKTATIFLFRFQALVQTQHWTCSDGVIHAVLTQKQQIDHHYLEGLNLLAWGRCHLSLSLQLDSSHTTLLLGTGTGRAWNLVGGKEMLNTRFFLKKTTTARRDNRPYKKECANPFLMWWPTNVSSAYYSLVKKKQSTSFLSAKFGSSN